MQSKPHCVAKFLPVYGQLYWSEMWHQLSYITLDRMIVDLNWKIPHGVLYITSWLVCSFHNRNVDPRCHCSAEEEMLALLFFECSFVQFLINWVYFHLLSVDPHDVPFTITKVLLGFLPECRRCIPKIEVWMRHVMKHRIWLARNNFRFQGMSPVAADYIQGVIVRIKFILALRAWQCHTDTQRKRFNKDWLVNGTLGRFVSEKLVFSF